MLRLEEVELGRTDETEFIWIKLPTEAKPVQQTACCGGHLDAYSDVYKNESGHYHVMHVCC